MDVGVRFYLGTQLHGVRLATGDCVTIFTGYKFFARAREHWDSCDQSHTKIYTLHNSKDARYSPGDEGMIFQWVANDASIFDKI